MIVTRHHTLIVALALALTAACKNKTEIDRTTALVRVDSPDLVPGIDVDAVDIVIRIDDQVRMRSYPLVGAEGSGWPIVLGVTPLRDQRDRFSVEAIAKREGMAVVSTTAASQFIAGEVGIIELRLEKPCIGVVCPESTACEQGGCTLAVERPLVPYQSAPLPDGGAPTSCAAPSACAAGETRCGPTGGLQTCEVVAGCPAWSAEVPCQGRLTCAGEAPGASCVCPPAPTGCEGGPGSTCASAQALETCAKDGDGCLFMKPRQDCPASRPCMGTFPDAACTCPAGGTACNGGAGAFCDSADKVNLCSVDEAGCLVAGDAITCPAGKPCTGERPGANCSCGAAPAECAGGAGTRCAEGNTLVRCGLDTTSGCIKVLSSGPCEGTRTCTGEAPNAACTCPATPPVCEAGLGRTCLPNNVVADCTMGADGCVSVTTTPCGQGQTCTGATPAARCACPAAPVDCPALGGTVCRDGSLVTCAVDTATGCLAETGTMSCAGTCAGSPGAAACCPVPPPVCAGKTGTVCSAGKLYTCSLDAQGCLVADAGKTCADGCSASACCPAKPAGCSGAGKVCSGTDLQTCSFVNGCLVATKTSCSSGTPCGGSYPGAECMCPSPPACTQGSCRTGSGQQLHRYNLGSACAPDANGCEQTVALTCGATEYCAGAPSNARCVPLITAGWPSAFVGSSDTFSPREIVGVKVSVLQSIWVQRLGVIASTTAPVEVDFQIRGVDANGRPSDSVSHSQPMTLTNGANEINIAFELPLTQGDVWLTIALPNTPGALKIHQDASAALGSAQVYSSDSGVSYPGRPMNIYIRGTPQ